MNETHRLKVLMLYRAFSPSVNLCGLVQFHWLQEHGHLEFRHETIHKAKKKDLLWADIVFFVRGEGVLDAWLAKLCHKSKKTTAYILDDDLLNVPQNLRSGRFYNQKNVKQHVRKTMRSCDYLVSPSGEILDRYGQSYKAAVPIIEPSLFQMDKKPKHADGKVHIGFAGSGDRGRDVDSLLTNALRIIMKKYKDRVCLEFFGSETELAKELRCKTYPYTNSYEEYQEKMAELNWDIGLAPMPDTQFHSCKHYNKLVEYCGFGIVGVYSKVLPYTDGVEHGITGMLSDNTTEAWVDALSELIENETLRHAMSQLCLDRARMVFSVETSAREFLSCMKNMDVCSNYEIKTLSLLPLIKLVDRIVRLIEKCGAHGWKLPVVVFKKASEAAVSLRR